MGLGKTDHWHVTFDDIKQESRHDGILASVDLIRSISFFNTIIHESR